MTTTLEFLMETNSLFGHGLVGYYIGVHEWM